MSAGGLFLLVVDPSSETAAWVNSLLRNAGINVHVLHADNAPEVGRLLREFNPFALLYHPAAEHRCPVAEAAAAARDADVQFVVRGARHDSGALQEALRYGTAAAVDQEDEGQLIALSRRMARLDSTAQQEGLERERHNELSERLRLLLDKTSDAIAYCHEGLHVSANPAYLQAVGYDQAERLEGVSLLELLECDGVDLKQLIRGFGKDQFPEQPLPCRITPREGPPFRATLDFSPTRWEGEACVQVLLRRDQSDLTRSAADDDALGRSALQVESEQVDAAEAAPAPAPSPVAPVEAAATAGADPLTGLMRRAPFMGWLEGWIDQLDQEHRGGVFFIQPDQAERELAEAPVSAMDRYTRAMARAIGSTLMEGDSACRFGDQAFVVSGSREGKLSLRDFGLRIQQEIHRLREREPDYLMPGPVSIGFVMLDPHHHDAEQAIADARAAWRQAREQGDTLTRFKPARRETLEQDEEQRWAQRLQYALDNDDFFTVQFSITNLEGETEGLFENRTVMHEDQGNVDTEVFLPAADTTGFGSRIDRHIIPGLFRAIAGGEARHIVNISGNSLEDFSFPNWLKREMGSYGIEGRRLVLQWSVHDTLARMKAARRLIEELSQTGCDFALADMDGAPRNREAAREFKPRYLRLDKSLTQDLRNHRDHVEQIELVVKEAQAINAVTIASDVSTSSDLAVLWQCGVKLVSGDFLQDAPRVIGV